MSVAADLIILLERLGATVELPRVRALLVPPPVADGSKDGEFCALELDDGSLGLSYVLLDDTLAALRRGDDAFALAGAGALDVARWHVSETGSRRTVGFAAINALSRHMLDRAGFQPPEASDSIGGLDPQPGERIGMIGLFPPLVKAIVASGARLTVVELRSELAGERDGFRVTLDPGELRGCRKVLSTSTVLLNDTLDDVLAMCHDAQRVVLIGPGAGCLPDPLFARGVSALGGTWITDAAGFRAALAEGAAWGRFARKFMLERNAWPGFEALLARVR